MPQLDHGRMLSDSDGSPALEATPITKRTSDWIQYKEKVDGVRIETTELHDNEMSAERDSRPTPNIDDEARSVDSDRKRQKAGTEIATMNAPERLAEKRESYREEVVDAWGKIVARKLLPCKDNKEVIRKKEQEAAQLSTLLDNAEDSEDNTAKTDGRGGGEAKH